MGRSFRVALNDRKEIAMAIQLEFVSVIVPVQRIRDLYPGGWSGFLTDNAGRIGIVV
jgi:hypothetical protein